MATATLIPPSLAPLTPERSPLSQRIAVVGSGISGLSAAWLLSRRHRVTLFEAERRLGGHTHTVDVRLDGQSFPVDTGFLVFNHQTYPQLTALFEHLGVETVASEMSFAVSLRDPELEWAGSNLATVFGQKRNLLRPEFWRMLADIVRFNRESMAWLANHGDEAQTLRQFLERGRYSAAFADWYLLPMAAAIWSCPAAQMLDYPLATFVRFCNNHGLLQIFDRPQWRTVAGGGREYVKKLAAGLRDVRLGIPVRQILRTRSDMLVVHDQGVEEFDQVVLACHSDQALALLGRDARPAEAEALRVLRYQNNHAVLHTDARLLPRDRSLWSAWNYLAQGGRSDSRPVSVSYLLNRLQPLPTEEPVVVTLNPLEAPATDKTIAQFDYAHPIFDRAAIAAQRQIAALSGQDRVWFAGAWNGYGFHEDGLKSGLAVAQALGCHAPWQEHVTQEQVA